MDIQAMQNTATLHALRVARGQLHLMSATDILNVELAVQALQEHLAVAKRINAEEVATFQQKISDGSAAAWWQDIVTGKAEDPWGVSAQILAGQLIVQTFWTAGDTAIRSMWRRHEPVLIDWLNLNGWEAHQDRRVENAVKKAVAEARSYKTDTQDGLPAASFLQSGKNPKFPPSKGHHERRQAVRAYQWLLSVHSHNVGVPVSHVPKAHRPYLILAREWEAKGWI